MLSMKAIAEIRRRHFLNGESIRALAREFKHSRNTICKHLATIEEPVYQREHQPLPALGDYVTQLTSWLERDIKLPRKQRRTYQWLLPPRSGGGFPDTLSDATIIGSVSNETWRHVEALARTFLGRAGIKRV